jgi:hypothetical protein
MILSPDQRKVLEIVKSTVAKNYTLRNLGFVKLYHSPFLYCPSLQDPIIQKTKRKEKS